MQKDEAVKFIYDRFQEENKALGLSAGMDEAELDNLIQQSSISLMYMFSNVYDRMVEAGLIN